MHEEEKVHGLTRRGIITTALLVPLVVLSAPAPAAESAFSPSQLRLIKALVDRLIPSDDSGPGARKCGVPTYIDWVLGVGDDFENAIAHYSGCGPEH